MIYEYDILEEENFRLSMTPEELKEEDQLLKRFASAGFNNQKVEKMLHDILWGKNTARISLAVKIYIADKYSTCDDAVIWSFRYLKGERLARFMRYRYLKPDMVSKVVENEFVSKKAISVFLNSYSSPKTKADYIKTLALANFTDDFFARIWEVSPKVVDNELRTVTIKRFREKNELDEEVIPDSWVTRMLDKILEAATQRMYASWREPGFGGLNGMDTVENVRRKALRL